MSVVKLSVIFLILLNILILVFATKIILVEDAKACFRRVLAGKRVADNFVKKSVPCERLDDCQRECNDEKRFVCEGFNYRLDQTGRGQGVCELLELPLSRLDIGRDVYPDKDYDYYERDRDSISPDCRPNYSIYSPNYSPSHSRRPIRPYDDGMVGGWTNRRPVVYNDRYPPAVRPMYEMDRYNPPTYDRHYSRRPYPTPNYPPPSYPPPSYPPPPPYKPSSYEPYLPSRDYYYSKSDFYRGHQSDRNFYMDSYNPRPPYMHRDYDRRYLPEIDDKKYYYERERDRNYWGLNKYHGPMQHHWASYGGSYGNFGKPDSVYYRNQDRRYLPKPTWYPNYDDFRKQSNFVPYQIGNGDKYRPPPNWGQYGGSYGSNRVDSHSYNYWGLDRNNYSDFGRYEGSKYGYLPNRYAPPRNGYIGVTHFVPPTRWSPNQDRDYYRPSIPPPTQRPYEEPNQYDCSVRSGTGLRMQKDYVRKFFSVPNIYECEKLCFSEKHFACYSYSFRYTVTPDSTSENCYLSDRPVSQSNMYLDTEPDRNFDIYSMNHGGKQCMQPDFNYGRQSDCFWRTRSGQRLDHSVVRDSLNVRSIGQCELECIRSNRFVCRSFSFRYGSPVIGGAIDNCQLTDWPYSELDPRHHLVPDSGFELYERGSYGHGCELNHFVIQGPWNDPHKMNVIPTESQKRCYIGYGRPAKLLPSAILKAISVRNEEECQLACTRKREQGPSTCMSFSFKTTVDSRRLPGLNCELSDITQRDLLLNLDYVHDPDYWLFAWDTFNPHCKPAHLPPPSRPPTGIAPPLRPPPSGPHLPSRPESPGGYLPDIDRVDLSGNENAWQHYSVKGLPCRRGSKCERNVILGYYSCEIEGGEVGSWDYCCRPSHRCGYSEGFDYPWCYVGSARDQWRKCNDRYYPYGGHGGPSNGFQSPNSLNKPYYTPTRPYLPKPVRPGLISYDVRDKPWIPHPGPSIDRFGPSHKPFPDDEFLDPPKPGGLGEPRYWPVAYLHKEPPPFTNQTSKDRYADDDNDSKKNNRKTQSRMMMEDQKKKNKTEDDDDFVRIDIIPKPDSNDTLKDSKDNTFLSYEVINNTDLPSENDTSKSNKSDEELIFETVDNVDTDDIFPENSQKGNNKNSTENPETTTKKVNRRGNIVFVTNPSRRLFQTGTGNLPADYFQQRLAKERSSLTAVQ